MENAKDDIFFKNKVWYRCINVLYGLGWCFAILISFFIFNFPERHVSISDSGFTCPNGINYNWKYMYAIYDKTEASLIVPDHFRALQACNLLPKTLNSIRWSNSRDVGHLSKNETLNYLFNIYPAQLYPYPYRGGFLNSEFFDPFSGKRIDPKEIQNTINEINSKRSETIDDIKDALNSELNPPYKINWVQTPFSVSEWKNYFLHLFVFFLISSIILDTLKNILIYISYGKKFSYLIINILKG